jgi:type IV pilus assembly protein PilA
MKKFFKYGNKGFTLIELLVVIAILGTLAAVVVLNVTKFIGSGRTESQATERHNVQTAVVAYMYDNPTVTSFPATTVTKGGSSGILATYLLTPTNCTYAIPLGGVVPASTDCLK